MLYRPDRGWGFQQGASNVEQQPDKFEELLRRVEVLEASPQVESARRRKQIIDQPSARKALDPSAVGSEGS
jgi:hypothetical protein